MPSKNNMTRYMTSKVILIVLSVVIIIHIGLMFYYLQNNRLVQQTARRDAVIQKIINTIYLVNATPIENRESAVSALDDPDLKVTLTAAPAFNLQFKKVSFWEISRALRNRLSNFTISIEMDKSQWLNLNATIYSHVFAEQLVFIGVEIFIFGTLLVSAWSINRFTRPLESFKEAATRLGIDLKSKPLDIYGPSVVREAARAMNQMQQRIIDLIRDRTQVLAAISHDLRTPITRMKLRTQFVDDESLADSYQKDLDEMEQMINETLAFAREDCSTEEPRNFDLVSMLSTICDDARDIGSDVTFNTRIHRIPFYGKPLAIKRAFTNLINNGVRYGKTVQVTLKQRNKHIWVFIDDEGPGINEKEKDRLFTPFYRAEQSRSRDTGGVGLGLAVTNDIIKAHEGKVVLNNRKPHGLRVVVELTSV